MSDTGDKVGGADDPIGNNSGNPLPPPTVTQNTVTGSKSIPIGPLAVLVGAAAAALGSILPWASVLAFSVNGFDGDGKITLIASGFSITCLVAALRVKGRQLLLAVLSTLGLGVAAGTFIYDAVTITKAIDKSQSEILGSIIRPGVGLLIGVVGSTLAFVVSLTLIAHTRRGLNIREASSTWGPREIGVLATSSAAVSLLAIVQWWVASVVVGVIAGIVWGVLRRPRLASPAVATFGLVAALAAIGGGIGEGVTRNHSAPRSTDSLSALASAGGSDAWPSCDSVFKAGSPTDDAANASSCTKDGSLTFVMSDRTECANGTTLVSNDFGWGFTGQTWNSASVAAVPIGTCTGLSADKCTEAFSPGVTTLEVWGTLMPQCLGADGQPTRVFTLSWPCFNSGKSYLQNDFGWGYVDEPWQAGEPPTDC